MKVKLYTKDGVLVHEQILPAFVEGQPDVIVWGDRIFGVPSVDGEVGRRFALDADSDYPYEEAFVYTLDPAQAHP